MERRTLTRIEAAIIALGCGVGCAIKLGLPVGEFRTYQLLYFTTLSNLLAMGTFLVIAVKGKIYPRWLAMVEMYLLLTGLVFWLLLNGNGFGGYARFSLDWWGDKLVHLLVPAAALLYWIGNRCWGKLKWWDPLLWTVFPYCYFGAFFAMAKGGLKPFPWKSNPYPYPFMDVWTLGKGAVLQNIGVLTLVFLPVAYGVVLLDKKLSR